jgi:Flp pilus assembly pilin Flp
MQLLSRVFRDRAGVAAVELGLVLGLITLSIMGAVVGLGDGVTTSYTNTAQKVADATP